MPQLRSKCSKRVEHLLMALLVLIGLSGFTPMLMAQNSASGTVTGQVTDAQGKAIVSAVVTLTNQATNGVTPTITNSAGRYSFTNLGAGTYSLAVKKTGFKSAAVKDQTVIVGKPLTINIPMQVGAATQTVEVTASGAELQTMNATVGNSISGATIAALPALNRDANSLTMLQPNTNPDGGVGGADSDQNSFSIDGGNNSNDMDGNNADYTNATGGMTSGVIPTPTESVEQFTVATSNQSADVNSAAGSSVSMVTKRGTNAVHGSVYDYYLGSKLSANAWGNNQSNVARGISHRNRFGAALGGEILPDWLGGKTYLFGNYEGLRYPNSAVFSRAVPTALLRAGVVQALAVTDSTATGYTGKWEAYNLNPNSVTVNGTAYAPATCTASGAGSVPCDPRSLGMNAVVAQLWNQYEPMPNSTVGGDRHNTLNYTASANEAQSSNFFVTRVDHDFGAKNHFELTYHWYAFTRLYPNGQADIGGGIPGDVKGVPTITSVRPQKPSMWTAEITSNISSNVTNNFNYSYLRNFWQWAGSYLKPTPLGGGLGTLGGALEIGGESNNALIPYNVNTQRVRTRIWDGIGNTFKDDVTVLHGNHLFQFGGRYTHQIDFHQRNDNGGGIMANNVYQITKGNGVNYNYLPTDFSSSADKSTYDTYYDEVLGIVSQPQTLYTRAGKNLDLQPLGTPMFDKSSIPMYNAYFADAWHIKPSLTLSYGAGYTVEMPPLEEHGKQVELVDGADNLVTTTDYLAQTEKAALSGQTYNPQLGFATVQNVGSGLKYPYKPFYGGFSPRVSLAWNPNISSGPLGWLFGGNKGVIRGGWSRIYGRLNGVDLVLVPLLGTGLGQPVSCIGASMTGGCTGVAGVNPTNAFRIGTDGMSAPLGNPPTQTLPQPYFPGELQNGVANASAGSGEVLDPKFKPNRSDEFDLTYQRQLTASLSTMIGYTGRIIRDEYQAVDLAAVPYMMTAGGEQFQTAFATLFQQIAADPKGLSHVTSSPFFTAALGGNNSTFCGKAGDCALAVAQLAGPNANGYIDPVNGNDVYGLWQKLQNNSAWTLGRTTASATTTCAATQPGCPASGRISGGGQLSAIYMNDSIGWGNFNSMFWSVNFRNFHGITGGSNLTWARSMGTGQVDQATSEYSVTNPFDLKYMYGPQFDSTPLQYNAYFVWTPGGKTQSSFLEHLVNGWSFAPIITWRRVGSNSFFGGADSVSNGGQCSSFGEMDCSTGNTIENAVLTTGYTGGSGIVRNSTYGNSDPGSGGTGMNRFADPSAIRAEFRPLVLGLDTNGNSAFFPGVSMTNVDFSVTKNLALSERFSTEINAQATNLFNHFSASENGNNISDPANFGVIGGNLLGARQVEVGLLVRW
ncbi:MAG: carboxypeptidase regulatory-like domain-containing protein [Acidobacteria bacterium]|nr:MAG: carboxypeptidase regulatory-like domain-containing protein [Acidobacteriota bacterium]